MRPPEDLRAFLDALLAAMNARDFEALPDLIERDHEFRSLLAETEGDVYVGIDGIRRWAIEIDETWADHRVEFLEVHETGPERAVVVTRNLGVAKLSGVPLDTRRGIFVTRRNGRLWRSVVYPDPADAFRAAGVEPR